MSAPLLVEPLRFRRAPLLAAAVWFGLGVLGGSLQRVHYSFTPVPLLLLAFLLLGLVAVVSLRRAARVAWVAVAAVWLALGFAAEQWQPSPAAPVGLMHFADNLSRTARGRIVRVHPVAPEAEVEPSQAEQDQVPAWERGEEAPAPAKSSVSLDLMLDSIEDVGPDTSAMVPIEGGLRVALYDPTPALRGLRCGDRLEFPVRLRPPERFRDPGAFQYGDYMLSQGIALQAGVAAARVEVLGAASAPTWRCRHSAAQAWAAGRVEAFVDSSASHRLPRLLRLDRADAHMLDATLFGDRSGLTHTLRTGFERTGTFHLFVVSGLHVALLAAGVLWLLTRLRLRGALATLLTIAATAAYAALTGFGQPAQRALVMTSVYLVARLLSRERDVLNALGAAVLALLIWSPSSLFEASFQMTALVIVAIGGIAIPLGRWSFLRYLPAARDVFREVRAGRDPREAQLIVMLELWGEAIAELLGRWARTLPARLLRAMLWVLELALVSLVAELVMVLPMATYFHRAAIFGVPANMVVLPVVALLAVAAVLTFLCSLLSTWLAVLPSAATGLLLHGVAWAIHGISHLAAADLRVPGPTWWVAGLALAAWAGCCWMVRRSARGAVGVALALPLIAAMILWPEHATATPGVLEITAIDVGQGDSLLAVNPAGSAMLIDAGGPVGRGGPAEIVSNFDLGEQVVAPYLWSRRLRRLDVVVLTHAHTDHMGGMPAILEDFRPRELWVGAQPGANPRSPLFSALLAEAARLGIMVRHLHAGDRVPWGPVDISVLSPAAGYANLAAPRNDDSLVLEMRFGRSSALLEGDAERPSEEAMLAGGLIHPVTLLKVAHHGSRTSTTQGFLDAAAPADAVISAGRRNTFGHPRGEVIARLAARGTHLFRTDELGLSTFLLGVDGDVREVVGGTTLPLHARR